MTYEAQGTRESAGKPQYAPDDLVTARQIAEYYGCKLTVPCGWADRGNITAVEYRKSARGVSVRLFRWADVLALDFHPGFLDQAWAKANCPRGHLTAQEAAVLVGRSSKMVNQYCAEGRMASAKVRCPGVKGRHVWFPTQKGVEDFLEKRRTYERHRKNPVAKPQDAPGGATFPRRPLIHPDHEVALEARRRLWEAAGRVMPKKYLARMRRKNRIIPKISVELARNL